MKWANEGAIAEATSLIKTTPILASSLASCISPNSVTLSVATMRKNTCVEGYVASIT